MQEDRIESRDIIPRRCSLNGVFQPMRPYRPAKTMLELGNFSSLRFCSVNCRRSLAVPLFLLPVSQAETAS